jgi:hypothetical protein
MDIRCIANLLLLTSTLLAAPSVSPAQPQSAGTGQSTECLATVLVETIGDADADSLPLGARAQCAGDQISGAGFVTNLDSGDRQRHVAIKAALAVNGSVWSGSISMARDNRAQVRPGQRLRRK